MHGGVTQVLQCQGLVNRIAQATCREGDVGGAECDLWGELRVHIGKGVARSLRYTHTLQLSGLFVALFQPLGWCVRQQPWAARLVYPPGPDPGTGYHTHRQQGLKWSGLNSI